MMNGVPWLDMIGYGGWRVVRDVASFHRSPGDQNSLRIYIPTSTLHHIEVIRLNIYLFASNFAVTS